MLGFVVYFFLVNVLAILAYIPSQLVLPTSGNLPPTDLLLIRVGKEYMISALQSIDRWVQGTQFQYNTDDAMATMKISGNTSSFMKLFSTHPPIEARVAALKRL